MKRMRTISQAIAEIRGADPDTAVTVYHVRELIRSGDLPVHHAGKKQLFDLDVLLDILGGAPAKPQATDQSADFVANKVRRIGG